MDFIFDPSLALYLPLYELDGSSFRSRDAYGHLCTVADASCTAQGRSFDGTDDKILVPDHSALNFDSSTDFSIFTWVNPESDATNYRSVVWKASGVAGFEGYYLRLDKTTGYALCGIDTDAPAVSEVADTTNHFGAGWVFLSMTCDRGASNGLKLYVDGQEANKGDASGGSIDNTSNLYVGIGRDGSTYPFYGGIGQVWIYNRALTPQEIQHVHLATKWRYQ